MSLSKIVHFQSASIGSGPYRELAAERRQAPQGSARSLLGEGCNQTERRPAAFLPSLALIWG
jgi:hypothetical protein